ncbi:hypothetical protein LIER_17652 [Lithospermum erythrorhizon]|uniref:Avr9/Cf-9 rapidly elicited protein 146 n=1 Tax=Lithospermum erythrorhizon TaxID=34254 RepID=A0AAV3QBD5_LITER
MEEHLPIVAKKFWNLVRVALFMLKQGISKSKILTDLNMVFKRGKLAGKAIQNLMFHHTHLWAAAASSSSSSTGIQRSPDRQLPFTPRPDEYEFSCSPSPDHHHGGVNFHLPLFTFGRRKNTLKNAPLPEEGQFEAAKVVIRAIEMLKSETTSPALPGFGKSPMVRQLRVTDSPFPIDYSGNEDDKHVDEEADHFIKRFYKDLRRQNKIAWGTPGR